MLMILIDSNLLIYIYINLLFVLYVYIYFEYLWSGYDCWKFFYGNIIFKIDEKIILEDDSYVLIFLLVYNLI